MSHKPWSLGWALLLGHPTQASCVCGPVSITLIPPSLRHRLSSRWNSVEAGTPSLPTALQLGHCLARSRHPIHNC